MTYEEQRQARKNRALNDIRKIYNPLAPHYYDNYGDESYSEQDNSRVRCIIESLEKDLEDMKNKFGKLK